jgi:hypothetical protein
MVVIKNIEYIKYIKNSYYNDKINEQIKIILDIYQKILMYWINDEETEHDNYGAVNVKYNLYIIYKIDDIIYLSHYNENIWKSNYDHIEFTLQMNNSIDNILKMKKKSQNIIFNNVRELCQYLEELKIIR